MYSRWHWQDSNIKTNLLNNSEANLHLSNTSKSSLTIPLLKFSNKIVMLYKRKWFSTHVHGSTTVVQTVTSKGTFEKLQILHGLQTCF